MTRTAMLDIGSSLGPKGHPETDDMSTIPENAVVILLRHHPPANAALVVVVLSMTV